MRRCRHPAGTRFRLFPEYASGFLIPETVWLSPRPGTIGTGPEDDQMYVANAVLKPSPYQPPDYIPPYAGSEFRPAGPDTAGHFDRIPVDSPQFLAAHVYGAARHTLDIWEAYLGCRVAWWHAPEIPRLELVPIVQWRNAHSGPGFLETGYMPDEHGTPQLFALNFDVIAHEIGHAILFSQVGVPASGEPHAEYLAFHESFSDLIALVGALNFESVIAKLFEQTGGNLYVLNLVNRMGKISDNLQIRIVSSQATMDDMRGLHLGGDGTWIDPSGQHRNQHALGQPLSGAIFDCLVEIYQDRLVALRLIPDEADARGWTRVEVEQAEDRIHRRHCAAMARFATGFRTALLEARDAVGLAMAHAICTLHPDTLTFARVAARFLEGACIAGEGANLGAMLNHFLRHGIDPLPFLRGPLPMRRDSARLSLRFDDPHTAPALPRSADALTFFKAHRHVRHAHREAGWQIHESAGR